MSLQSTAADPLYAQPRAARPFYATGMRQSNFQTGLAQVFCVRKGLECSSLQTRTVKHQGRVRIDDVALGSIRILRRRMLLKLIAVRDRSILSDPTERTPSAVTDLKCNRNIQGCPINPCLAAGYDSLYELSGLWHNAVSLRINSWFWE